MCCVAELLLLLLLLLLLHSIHIRWLMFVRKILFLFWKHGILVALWGGGGIPWMLPLLFAESLLFPPLCAAFYEL